VTLFREGMVVSFIGDGHDELTLGNHGKILAFASDTAGHVQWLDGPLRGSVTLHDLAADFAPSSQKFEASRDGLEDSLEVGPVAHTSARSVYDMEGSLGVLSMLASAGYLANFESIADEAQTFVQQRIRQESSLREALSQLDDDEGEELVSLASRVLLHDAFGNADDE
jgi:hypothetical protein